MALRWLMSFIPAAVAALAIVVVWFYPLTRKRVHEITNELKEIRAIQ
jgi:GPH family glycoside/pentoside/hexuronide:cation symporter